jgi:hypothetical protein
MSKKVEIKLREKHGLFKTDVMECFANRDGGFLKDIREEHKTDPETVWFIAQNNMGKQIKIVFMQLPDKTIVLKTAYQPNMDEISIYQKQAYPR